MRDYEAEDRAIREQEDLERLQEDVRVLAAERDALLNLIVERWDRVNGDGTADELYRVNLAWWDTADTAGKAVEMVRVAAKLPEGSFSGWEPSMTNAGGRGR